MYVPSEVINIWDKYNFHAKRRKHSLKVAEIALRLAERIKDVNKDLVNTTLARR